MRHIRLFKAISLFFVGILLAQPLSESISLRVKIVGRVFEEKPRLKPPERIELESGVEPLDLSAELLEPPKEIEEADIDIPKEGQACGEPKDRHLYRMGVKYYSEGKLKLARSRMLDVLSVGNSAFIPMAQYILGLVNFKTKNYERAEEFFRQSCEVSHIYRQASCESLYALEFMLRGEPVQTDKPELWRVVYGIKEEGAVRTPSCEGVIFRRYCKYVLDFAQGRINEDFSQSTELRRALLLLKEGKYGEAKELFNKYSAGLSRYRDIATYYLGFIAYAEGRVEEAYRYATFLETLRPELAQNLHLLIAGEDVALSRIAYSITGSKEALVGAGIHSYNRGNYRLAYREFTKAGRHLFASYSALMEGDYQSAYRSLKRVKSKNRDYYRWLLETLYWLGRDEEMEKVLREVREKYPEIYREYMGWLSFKKERWMDAYRFFEDPYHKALALFNAGRHAEVLGILSGAEGYKERILKAKASISMGKGALARRFLTENTPSEVYLLGMSYFIEGNYRKAMSYYEKLLQDEELRSKALLRIADSHYNLGNYEEAKRLYKEILKEHPDSQEALEATLALAQIELQKPSDDLETLVGEFSRRFPDSPMIPDLKYQLASVYINKGDIERAKTLLEELLGDEQYRARALLKLAETEKDPLKREDLLKEVIKEGQREEKEKAVNMLMSLYLERKEFEKLADFLSKGDFEDRKKALSIYISENIGKAIELYEALHKENPKDEELKETALSMYHKTKGKKYLHIAKESENPKVRAEALYLLGLIEKKRDKKKALEYFIEVVLSAEGVQPYYNRSIVESANILVSLKARRDASCLLEKLDHRYLSKKDIKRVKILREKLPKCEVKE